MVHFQDTYTPGSPRMQDWSTEITPPGQRRSPVMVGTEPGRNMTGMTAPAQATPPALSDMQNDLPVEVIQAPTSVGEAYLGSWKALLSRYGQLCGGDFPGGDPEHGVLGGHFVRRGE